MTPDKRFAAALAALVMAASAGTAAAATYRITYAGQVTSGFDSTAEFGLVQSLAGLPFSASYVLTFPTSGAIVDTDGTSFQTISGGTNFGTVATPLTGALTINGVTRSVSGNLAGSVSQFNNFNGGLDIVSHVVNEGFQDSTTSVAKIINLGVGSFSNNIVNSIDFAESVNYTVQPGDFATGNFRFFATHTIAGDPSQQLFYDSDASGDVLVQSLSIASISATPEPASWAMMILGFGVAGSTLRRRRFAWAGTGG